MSAPVSRDWRHSASCLGEDSELFFPIGTNAAAQQQAANAKAVCVRCPVIADCRDWALSVRDLHGIAGGLDETQRAVIHRRADRAATRARKAARP